MLEIPGEEAPTDPGLAARMKREAAEKVRQAAARGKSRLLGVVAAVALVGLAGSGAWWWRQQQQALVYEIEDYYALPLEDLQAAPVAVAIEPDEPDEPDEHDEPVAVVPEVKRPPKQVGTSSVAMNVPGGTDTRNDGAKRGSEVGVGTDMTLAGSGRVTDGAVGISGGGVRIERIGDVVLTDESEIFEMAKRVLSAYAPQVQTCYVQALKQREGLQGVWSVNFIITTDGGVRSVKVKGDGTPDPELEQCIGRVVSAWKFQKIAKERPLSKPYRFGPSGW